MFSCPGNGFGGEGVRLTEIPKQSSKKFGWCFALAGVAGSVWFLAYVGYMPGPAFVGPWTRWLPIFGLAILGVISLVASLVSLKNRRWASALALVPCTALFALWAWGSRHFDEGPERLFVNSPLGEWLGNCLMLFPVLLLSGLFWMFTRKAQPILAGPVSTARKILGVVLLLVLVPIGSVLMSVCLLGEDNYFRDLCGPPAPFTAQREPQQVVFTSRILRSFRSPSLGMERWEEHGALVRVEKTFWGLPRWYRGPALVLTPTARDWDPFRGGPMYFMDADRLKGSLTRFLPVFRDHHCTRTAPLQDSEIQLRVLHDGLPASGLRILGETIRLRQEKDSDHYTVEKVPHVNVTIQGGGRSIAAVSDEHGIYDVSGVAADYYQAGTADGTGKMQWTQFCCPNGSRYPICECTVYVH